MDRKHLAVVVALAVCGACARKSPPTTSPSAVELSVAETTHDFGPSEEGATLKHTFMIENKGATALTVAAKTYCGCTIADLKKTQIPAGQKVELEVTFNTLDQTGDQDKLITVSPIGSPAPPMKLRVKSHVEPMLHLVRDKKTEDAEELHLGAKKTIYLYVKGTKAQTVNLQIVKITNPDITAEVVKKPETKEQVIHINLVGSKLGHFHDGIFLKTDLEKKPMLTRFFGWNVEGNLNVLPMSLHFETGPNGVSGPDERVSVIKSRLEGFEVTSVKSNSDALTAQTKKVGQAVEVHVKVADQKKLLGIKTAEITLATNDKVQPVVRLPITVAAAWTPPRSPVANAAAPKP